MLLLLPQVILIMIGQGLGSKDETFVVAYNAIIVVGMTGSALILLLTQNRRIQRHLSQMEVDGGGFSASEVSKLFLLLATKGVTKKNFAWISEIVRPSIERFRELPVDERARKVRLIEGVLSNWQRSSWYSRVKLDESTDFVEFLLNSFPEIDQHVRRTYESQLEFIRARSRGSAI